MSPDGTRGRKDNAANGRILAAGASAPAAEASASGVTRPAQPGRGVAPLRRAVNLGASMAPSESPTVDPIIPLLLLETVRDVDRPDGAAEAEYVPELLNKRLGMTDTVLAQIRRYTSAVERGERIARTEVVALARLVGRRPDAGALFQSVGVATARAAYARISALRRGVIRILPGPLARPLARRQVGKIESRYFASSLTSDFGPPLATAYHDAGMDELLHLLSLT